MVISLTNNTFVRVTGKRGYIANTLRNVSFTFDEIGAVFLNAVQGSSCDFDVLISSLRQDPFFCQITEDELREDLLDFYKQLAKYELVYLSENYDNENILEENLPKHQPELPQLLKSLFFEITDKCNERCIHCYIPNNKKIQGELLPIGKFKEIIDDFCLMGGKGVILSGGEVMLHHDLISMIQYCSNKKLDITLYSNCVLMTEKQLQKIKQLGVSEIQVSLYSMSPDIHDAITQLPGSCNRTIDSINRIHKTGMSVKIAVSVLKQNVDGIIDILKFAKEKNIEVSIDLAIMAREDKSVDNLNNRLNIEDVKRLISNVHKYDPTFWEKKYKRNIINDENDNFDFLRFLNRHVCEVGVDNLCIAANGDVIPCSGWNGYVLGNIYENTLTYIWRYSERLKELRAVKEKDFKNCINCSANNYCMRCMNRNYNECDGDMYTTPKHFCDVAYSLKKIIDPEISQNEKNSYYQEY